MKALATHKLLLPGVLALAGCQSVWKDVQRDPLFKPNEGAPIRVAVLGFSDESGGTSVFLYPFLPFIWLANLVTLSVPEGTPDSAKGAATLRALLVARLRGSNLNIVDPSAIDTTLAHKGLLDGASKMDSRELGRILGVDAVVFGELERWSGRYYVLESETGVGAKIRVLSTVNGAELFRGSIGVTESSGISGGPTGYVSLAATPLAALGTGPYRQLAIQWAELMGSELVGETTVDPQNVPPLPYVSVAVVTDPPSGGFKSGDLIEVVAAGATDCKATFDIGTLRVRIPMAEFARQPRTGVPGGEISGLYRGSYSVSEVDRVVGAPIVVNLQSRGGRATMTASNGPVTIGAVVTPRAPRTSAR